MPVPLMTSSQGTTTFTMPVRGGRSYPSEKKKDENVRKPNTLADQAQKKPVEINPADEHGVSFGVVYANELASAELAKPVPAFPVGAIIVREKNETATSAAPQLIIAMVKREKGFSAQTGDWEFFVFNGADMKMQTRGTKSDCSACHIKAEKTDWVFRDYMK